MAAKKPISSGKLSHFRYTIESKAPGNNKWTLANTAGQGYPVEYHRDGVDPHLKHVADTLADTMMPTVGGVRMDRLDDPLYRAGLQSPEVQANLPFRNLNGHQFRVMRYPIFHEFKPDGTLDKIIRTGPTINPEAGEVVPMPDVTPKPLEDDTSSARPSSSNRLLPIRPHGNTGNPTGNLGKAVGKDPGKNKRARREAAEAAAPKKPAAKKPATKTAAAPAAKKPAAKKKTTITVTPEQLAAEVAKRTGKK
jgi:hypothetical protein